MLPNMKFCLIPWLLLVELSCQPAMTSPLEAHGKLNSGSKEICVTFSKALLRNVTDVMALDNLFKGINCSEQRIKMNSTTSTVSACLPAEWQQASVCTGFQNSNFDQEECLRNVVADLQHYKALFLDYSDPILESTVVQAITDLVENSEVKDHSFDERLQMCKILKGFQVRAITISRVLNYILTDVSSN